MTGTFELFTDQNLDFRFRLKAPDGTVMALSRSFPDKAAAVAGISAVREYAGMGLITDLCPDIPLRQPSTTAAPGARTAASSSTAARPAGVPPPKTATGTPERPGRPGQGAPGRETRRPQAA